MSIGCVASFINPSARVPASQLCTLYWQLCGLGVRFAAVLLKLHDYVHKDTFDTLKDETVSESTRRLSRGDCHGDCVCDDLRTVHMIVIEAKGGDLHGSNDTRTPREQRDTRHVFRWHRCIGRGGGQLNWRTNALHIERVFDARPSHHFLYDFFTSLYPLPIEHDFFRSGTTSCR